MVDILWKLPVLRRLNRYMNESRDRLIAIEQRQDNLERICNQLLAELRVNQNDNRNIFNEIKDNVIDSRGELNTLIKQEQIRFWSSYSQATGNSIEDAKKQFFQSIPKADSKGNALQIGNAKLLRALVDICDENGWEYWLQSGTLLGAIRHKGYVPWDDDTDIAMFREDIVALRKYLEKNDKYRVTLVYDWFVKSRQIRFRFKDEIIPCFVDIYIYDRCKDGSRETWSKRCDFRQTIVNEWESSDSDIARKWKEVPYTDENSEIAPELKNYFDNKVLEYKKAFEDGDKNGVMWGIDNFDCNWQRSFDKDFLFPQVYLDYENEKYKAPRQYLEYVKRQYGDIYELPMDLATHYVHVDKSLLTEEVIEKIMSK